jgi:hypothetical protein
MGLTKELYPHEDELRWMDGLACGVTRHIEIISTHAIIPCRSWKCQWENPMSWGSEDASFKLRRSWRLTCRSSHFERKLVLMVGCFKSALPGSQCQCIRRRSLQSGRVTMSVADVPSKILILTLRKYLPVSCYKARTQVSVKAKIFELK